MNFLNFDYFTPNLICTYIQALLLRSLQNKRICHLPSCCCGITNNTVAAAVGEPMATRTQQLKTQQQVYSKKNKRKAQQQHSSSQQTRRASICSDCGKAVRAEVEERRKIQNASSMQGKQSVVGGVVFYLLQRSAQHSRHVRDSRKPKIHTFNNINGI